MKFLIFNGPPRCGKTTIAREASRLLRERHNKIVYNDSFAQPMKHFIAVALAMKYDEIAKDSMNAVLSGYTPREFLIHLSEHYMKPRYGEDVYGRLLYHRAMAQDPIPDVVVIDDSGFPAEVGAVQGYKAIVRIEREGTSYEGDSRNYLPDPKFTIDNSGDFASKTCPQLNYILQEIAR